MYRSLLPALVLFSVIYTGCKSVNKKSDAETVTGEPAVGIALSDTQMVQGGIVVGAVETGKISSLISVNGTVEVPPQNLVSVSFPLGGYLKNTKLIPGMQVKKGEVIATMENETLVQLQQDYLVTKSKLDFLEKEYQRQLALNQEKINSDKTLQQVTSEYTSQKVMLRAYAEKLRLVSVQPERIDENNITRSVPVYSPINGFVSKVNVNTGKFVLPTDVLFELINPDDIHAALTIFEKDLGKIRIGQQVKVSFVDEPEKQYEAEVILITQHVDEDKAAIAHCHFLNHPRQLLPGMYLRADIAVTQEQAQLVPEEAVVRHTNHEYVFTETAKNQFKMVEVQTGARENGMVEIRSSSDSLRDKKIVVKNAFTVLGALMNTAEEE